MGQILLTLGRSLVLTLALELGFALLWGMEKRDLPLAALVNVLTNPVVVLSHMAARGSCPGCLWAVTLALEAGAVGVEGWFYHSRGRVRFPWAFALCANLFSYTVGYLL